MATVSCSAIVVLPTFGPGPPVNVVPSGYGGMGQEAMNPPASQGLAGFINDATWNTGVTIL